MWSIHSLENPLTNLSVSGQFAWLILQLSVFRHFSRFIEEGGETKTKKGTLLQKGHMLPLDTNKAP